MGLDGVQGVAVGPGTQRTSPVGSPVGEPDGSRLHYGGSGQPPALTVKITLSEMLPATLVRAMMGHPEFLTKLNEAIMVREKMIRRKINLRRAVEIQEELARRLILEPCDGTISLVAGADFSYNRAGDRIGAVVVVMKLPGLELVEAVSAVREVDFPYIPGFLSFREVPAFVEAFQKIRLLPDVTLFDGNGIAHPRRMGLASHAGVLLDIPTVGCAKRPFFPFKPPALRRGAYTQFRDQGGEKVGYCLRTRTAVKPVFVSPGHRVDFSLSRQVVLECSRFRIPEPLRQAHLLSRRIFFR